LGFKVEEVGAEAEDGVFQPPAILEKAPAFDEDELSSGFRAENDNLKSVFASFLGDETAELAPKSLVCGCIYMLTHIYINIFIYVYIYLYKYYICTCIYMSIYLYINTFLFIYIYVYILYICMYVYVHIFVCISMCTYLYVCIDMLYIWYVCT